MGIPQICCDKCDKTFLLWFEGKTWTKCKDISLVRYETRPSGVFFHDGTRCPDEEIPVWLCKECYRDEKLDILI